MIEVTGVGKICSFCGVKWDPEQRFMGGFGAQICAACATRAAERVTDDEKFMAGTKAPWATMTTEELLSVLPNILATSEQVDEFLHGWVGMLRQRGASWQKIGLALGVSRQAAWERFTRVNRSLTKRADRG
jgi:hypothetical protein